MGQSMRGSLYKDVYKDMGCINGQMVKFMKEIDKITKCKD